tara:strand:+ start:664 stop:1848 length:1185 start_codon:yes stop_codon:yes gene_type:complete
MKINIFLAALFTGTVMLSGCNSTANDTASVLNNTVNVTITQNVKYDRYLSPDVSGTQVTYKTQNVLDKISSGRTSRYGRDLNWYSQYLSNGVMEDIKEIFISEIESNFEEKIVIEAGLSEKEVFEQLAKIFPSIDATFMMWKKPWQPGNGPRVVGSVPQKLSVTVNPLGDKSAEYVLKKDLITTYFIYSMTGENSRNLTTTGSLEVTLHAKVQRNEVGDYAALLTVKDVNIEPPKAKGEVITEISFAGDKFLKGIDGYNLSVDVKVENPLSSYLSKIEEVAQEFFEKRNQEIVSKWNSIGDAVWGMREHDNYAIGEKVCDKKNRIGNIEVVGPKNFKIWWESRVIAPQGYFFGGLTIEGIDIDNPEQLSFRTENINEQEWVKKGKFSACSFINS